MDNYTTSQASHKSASHKRVDCALLHQLLGVARSTLVREKLIFFDAKRLLSPQNRKYSALKAIIPYWQDPDEIWVDPSLLITMRTSNPCPLPIFEQYSIWFLFSRLMSRNGLLEDIEDELRSKRLELIAESKSLMPHLLMPSQKVLSWVTVLSKVTYLTLLTLTEVTMV